MLWLVICSVVIVLEGTKPKMAKETSLATMHLTLARHGPKFPRLLVKGYVQSIIISFYFKPILASNMSVRYATRGSTRKIRRHLGTLG